MHALLIGRFLSMPVRRTFGSLHAERLSIFFDEGQDPVPLFDRLRSSSARAIA